MRQSRFLIESIITRLNFLLEIIVTVARQAQTERNSIWFIAIIPLSFTDLLSDITDLRRRYIVFPYSVLESNSPDLKMYNEIRIHRIMNIFITICYSASAKPIKILVYFSFVTRNNNNYNTFSNPLQIDLEIDVEK